MPLKEKINNFMKETTIASYPVNTCFVCGTEGKQKYNNLNDRNFGNSSGWNIFECTRKECGLDETDELAGGGVHEPAVVVVAESE